MGLYDETIGAAFIGFAVACVLFGVLSLQIYEYFQRYTYDRVVYKFFVISIWLLEIFHSVLSGHTVYYYAITSYGNAFAILIPTWSIIIQVTVGAFISVLVKSAFAMRVWRFSNKNIFLTGFIALLNCAILALAVIFTIKAFKISTFAEISELNWVITSVLSVSVFTDILIASALTYYLHHLRNGFVSTGKNGSNTIITGLMKYSIETGAVTSVCGVATLIAFNSLPTTFVYMSFFFVLSKLYSNSLLATLNTRRSVRGRGTDRAPGTEECSDFTMIKTGLGHGTGAANGTVGPSNRVNPTQTTHSVFGVVDWSKQIPDIEVNVLQEVTTDKSRYSHHCDDNKRYDETSRYDSSSEHKSRGDWSATTSSSPGADHYTYNTSHNNVNSNFKSETNYGEYDPHIAYAISPSETETPISNVRRETIIRAPAQAQVRGYSQERPYRF